VPAAGAWPRPRKGTGAAAAQGNREQAGGRRRVSGGGRRQSPRVPVRPFRRPAQAAAQQKRGPESGAAAAKVWPPRRPRERDGSGSARGTSSFENREEISVPR
jgi:hypothetical protein